MAFERTYAAWVRTGLAALAFGMAIRGLKADVPGSLSRLAESGLILFGALCFVAGLHRLRASVDELPANGFVALRVLRVMSWILLAASGAALLDIWVA